MAQHAFTLLTSEQFENLAREMEVDKVKLKDVSFGLFVFCLLMRDYSSHRVSGQSWRKRWL